MSSKLPEPAQVLRAIDLYMSLAYTAAPSLTVQKLLETIHTWGGDFYKAPVFARTGDPDSPRCSARLGNQFYPHMKLVLEPAPSGTGYLYKADTHDRHFVQPPDHPEAAELAQLRGKNQRIAEEIEAAWADAGIPTFKTYLQQDLERRRQEGGGK